MEIQLDHVQVAAPEGCEEAARRFYGELIGLAEVDKPEALRARGGVWFALADRQLHIGVDDRFAPARKAHPAFSVPAAELDSLAARLQSAGAGVTWDKTLPGRRRFYCEDPWGNRLEFLATEG
ncbi:MAG TPA: VOC family protein [Solirubrobacterales bacterium]|nr:VOC family protein [Solirubrobacterales bacterium]